MAKRKKSWFGNGQQAAEEFGCTTVTEVYQNYLRHKVSKTTVFAYFDPEKYQPISARMKLRIDEILQEAAK